MMGVCGISGRRFVIVCCWKMGFLFFLRSYGCCKRFFIFIFFFGFEVNIVCRKFWYFINIKRNWNFLIVRYIYICLFDSKF